MQIASYMHEGRIRHAASAGPLRAVQPLHLSRQIVAGTLLAVEAISIFILGLASHWVLASQWMSASWPFHLVAAILGAMVGVAAIRICKGYSDEVGERLAPSLVRMLVGWTGAATAIGVLIVASAAGSPLEWSWYLTWIVSATASLVGIRIAHHGLTSHWLRTGVLTRNIAVFGVGSIGQELIGGHFAEPQPGVRIVGVFDDRTERSPDYCCGYPVRGDVDDLIEYARDHRLDEVIIALPFEAEERLKDVFAKLREIPVEVKVAAPMFEVAGERPVLEKRGSVPVVDVMAKPLSDWQLVAKEIEDRLLGLMILLLISPVLAVVAVLIKLESPGPVLFRQMRYGYNNRLIEVLKFRTMRHDLTDENAERLTSRNDPRVTRLGAVLRRTSLDELPQFINVVRGEMSIVGPRPHARSAKAGGLLYHDAVGEYPVRHKVKPGITGLAQISGWRGETRTVDQIRGRVERDIAYINRWSLLTDLKIILLTVVTGFFGRNAY